jgi:predicted amidohydrolase YtcJ
MKIHHLGALATITLLLVACNPDTESPTSTEAVISKTADLVLLNGYVYTVDSNRTIAEAVAVLNGEIIQVGSTEEVQKLQGPETQVFDLGGRMLLPGLHDAHLHVFGIVKPDVCTLESEPLSLEDMVPVIEDCIIRYSIAEGDWVPVDMWSFSYGNEASERLPDLRAALDAVSTKHPIILWGNDGHHGAVNSRALELARDPDGQIVGLNAETLNGVFSEYRELVGVNAQGEPNGSLNEQARSLFGQDRRSSDDLGPLLPQIGEKLASLGLTSVQDAALSDQYFPWLDDFEESGQMNFRFQAVMRLDPLEWEDKNGQIQIDAMMQKLESYREHYKNSKLISANAAKIFVDGVIEGNPLADPPTLPNAAVLQAYKQPRISYNPATQSASIDGYVDTASEVCQQVQASTVSYNDAGKRDEFISKNGFHPAQCTISTGVLRDTEPFIDAYVRRLNDAGFTAHIHVIGDRAVRVAVNALAAVMDPAAGNPLRHTLAHLQLIHPEEQQRIGELGLYLAFTYAWMLPDLPYDMSVMPFIDQISSVADLYDPDGYYMQNNYPVRTTLEAGAVLLGGSDAPVDNRSPRPFHNMALGITRENPDGAVMNPEKTVDVYQMIEAYTINGAKDMKQEALVGSIEVGKRADLAVLNQNIIDLYEAGRATEITDTLVDLTVFDGRVIYQRELQ